MGLEVIKQAPIYVQLESKFNLLDWVATEGMSWRVVKAPAKRASPERNISLLNEEVEQYDQPICDMFWSDSTFSDDVLLNLSAFQKVNHFPGMYMISNKL